MAVVEGLMEENLKGVTYIIIIDSPSIKTNVRYGIAAMMY